MGKARVAHPSAPTLSRAAWIIALTLALTSCSLPYIPGVTSPTTGLVKNDSVATTYRLRATGDMVTVAPLPQSEALPYASPLTFDPPLRIRGRAAQATITVNGTTAVRWVENDTVFEMSSRTLTIAQLSDLANKLR